MRLLKRVKQQLTRTIFTAACYSCNGHVQPNIADRHPNCGHEVRPFVFFTEVSRGNPNLFFCIFFFILNLLIHLHRESNPGLRDATQVLKPLDEAALSPKLFPSIVAIQMMLVIFLPLCGRWTEWTMQLPYCYLTKPNWSEAEFLCSSLHQVLRNVWWHPMLLKPTPQLKEETTVKESDWAISCCVEPHLVAIPQRSP